MMGLCLFESLKIAPYKLATVDSTVSTKELVEFYNEISPRLVVLLALVYGVRGWLPFLIVYARNLLA